MQNARTYKAALVLVPAAGKRSAASISAIGTKMLTTSLSNFDFLSMAQWTYNSATQTFRTFDDPSTVAIKMFYVQARGPGGLGGAYF